MSKISTAEYARRWSVRLKFAAKHTRYMKELAENPTGKKAIAAKEAHLALTKALIAEGLWSASMLKVVEDEYTQRVLEAATDKFRAGIDKAKRAQELRAKQYMIDDERAKYAMKHITGKDLESGINRMTIYITERRKHKQS